MLDRDWAISESTRAAIDALFACCTNTTPGAALAIYRDGEVVYSTGYGMANLEHTVPITPSSVFDIASISKQVTAMCVALLQQDGLLHVDDAIQTYIPELPEWDHQVTIRHLIHHVSGIRDYLSVLPLAGWRAEDHMTNADCLKFVGLQSDLEFEPNTKFDYSNSGYVLLAILVERVAGKPMAKFANERILARLGMHRSHFNDDHATVIPGRAQAYSIHGDGRYRLDMMPLDDLVGDGALFTTVEDFGKWIGNFSTRAVGGAELLAMMQTPGTFKDGSPMTYGWGLGVDEFHGYQRVGHSGGWAGYSSDSFRLPTVGFGVTIFANGPNIHPGVLTAKIGEIVLKDILREHNGSDAEGHSAHAIDLTAMVEIDDRALAGIYVEDSGVSHLIIDFSDDVAFIGFPRGNLILQRQDDGTYTQKWGHFVIVPTSIDAGGVQTLNVQMVREGSTLTYIRVPAPAAPRLDEFSGRYQSQELDTFWDIAFDMTSGNLSVSLPRSREVTYRPVMRDWFGTGGLARGGTLRFQRDTHGSVAGFTYAGDGISRIVFTKHA